MSVNHCRIWDGQSMHYLPDVFVLQADYAAVWLENALVLINRVNPKEKRVYEPSSPWKLMLSIGQPDSQGSLIYENDIVRDNNHLWVVRPDPERCGYKLVLAQSKKLSLVLDRTLARSLTVVGNCLENAPLLSRQTLLA